MQGDDAVGALISEPEVSATHVILLWPGVTAKRLLLPTVLSL